MVYITATDAGTDNVLNANFSTDRVRLANVYLKDLSTLASTYPYIYITVREFNESRHTSSVGIPFGGNHTFILFFENGNNIDKSSYNTVFFTRPISPKTITVEIFSPSNELLYTNLTRQGQNYLPLTNAGGANFFIHFEVYDIVDKTPSVVEY